MDLTTDLLKHLDPVIYARQTLGFDPDPIQQRILRSNSKRLLLNCARQFGKTTLTAIKALRHAKAHANGLIIVVGVREEQAKELLLKVHQMVLMDPEISLRMESKTHLQLENGARIIVSSASPAGVRGYSNPGVVIVDEAGRVPDEMYVALKPMLLGGGSMWMLSTPAGKRGYFYLCWEDDGAGWEKYRVTIYDNPRASKEFIESERRSMPARAFQQEYECVFLEPEGAVFAHDMIQSLLDESDERPMYDSIIDDGTEEPMFAR